MEMFWVAVVGLATNDMPYTTYSILIIHSQHIQLTFVLLCEDPFCTSLAFSSEVCG